MPHLCGRILKPCQWSHFETELTSSLAVIRANPLVPQESDLEKKTPDTSGLTSATSSGQLDLFDVSLKMSKDTLVSDSERSLATWKALVTKLRGEYSQRVKLALLIRESESTSWGTPAVNDANKTPHCEINSLQAGLSRSVGRAEANWATPNTMDHLPPRSEEATRKMQEGQRKGRKLPCNLREQVDEATMKLYQDQTPWPTPRVSSANGPSQNEIEMGNPKKRLETEVIVREPAQWPTPRTTDTHQGRGVVEINGKLYRPSKALSEGKLIGGANLADSVKMWPTPTVQDSDKATKKMRDNHQNNLTAVVFDQESFPTPTASEAEHYRMRGNSQMSQSLSAKARKGELLPTPTTRDWKGGYKEDALTRKDGKSRRFDALPNAAIGGVGTDIVSGHLNPDWVEWLMGVPTGWTALDFWETE